MKRRVKKKFKKVLLYLGKCLVGKYNFFKEIFLYHPFWPYLKGASLCGISTLSTYTRCPTKKWGGGGLWGRFSIPLILNCYFFLFNIKQKTKNVVALLHTIFFYLKERKENILPSYFFTEKQQEFFCFFV